MAALQAEACGLAEQMHQALKDGDNDKYLRLMAREHAIPRDLGSLEADVRDLRLRVTRERYQALADAEPGLRARYEETVRRNREKIAAIEAES